MAIDKGSENRYGKDDVVGTVQTWETYLTWPGTPNKGKSWKSQESWDSEELVYRAFWQLTSASAGVQTKEK